eukprot:SAG11_NODE_2466_length_3324_cov_1.192558_3_plen_391_part_00
MATCPRSTHAVLQTTRHEPPKAGISIGSDHASIVHGLIEQQAVGQALDAFPTALNAVGGLFCIADPQRPDCPLTYVSPHFMRYTGYNPWEIVGKNCRFLQTAETDKAVVAKIAVAIKKNQVIEALLVNAKKSGELFTNHVYMQPIADKSGKTVRYLGVQTPIQTVGVRQDLISATDFDPRKDSAHPLVRNALQALDFSRAVVSYRSKRCVEIYPANLLFAIDTTSKLDNDEECKHKCKNDNHPLTRSHVSQCVVAHLRDGKTIGRFTQVCREWRDAGMYDKLWQELYDSRWPSANTPTLGAAMLVGHLFSGMSARNIYRRRLESECSRAKAADEKLKNYAWLIELEKTGAMNVPSTVFTGAVMQSNADWVEQFPDIFETQVKVRRHWHHF